MNFISALSKKKTFSKLNYYSEQVKHKDFSFLSDCFCFLSVACTKFFKMG